MVSKSYIMVHSEDEDGGGRQYKARFTPKAIRILRDNSDLSKDDFRAEIGKGDIETVSLLLAACIVAAGEKVSFEEARDVVEDLDNLYIISLFESLQQQHGAGGDTKNRRKGLKS